MDIRPLENDDFFRPDGAITQPTKSTAASSSQLEQEQLD